MYIYIYNSTIIFYCEILHYLLVRFDHVISFTGQISANTLGQISPRKLSTHIEFGFFCLHQNMVSTNSASRFGSAGIELRK